MNWFNAPPANCMLRHNRNRDFSCNASMCAGCGWDVQEHSRRVNLAKKNGLTRQKNGLYRLIITKKERTT